MINLFQNFYTEKNILRKKEIDTCMANNSTNIYLNFIPIESEKRLTFSDMFSFINQISSDDDINIISNLDIFFDDSILKTLEMNSEEAFALSRWEVGIHGNVIFSDRDDSQDTWIVKGKVKNVFGDFNLGFCGCDNRIAHEFVSAGYRLSNPSKTIKTFHLHATNIRCYVTYGPEYQKHLVPEPYLKVTPVLFDKR